MFLALWFFCIAANVCFSYLVYVASLKQHSLYDRTKDSITIIIIVLILY